MPPNLEPSRECVNSDEESNDDNNHDQHVANSDFSYGNGSSSLEMAEYLDSLEASEQVNDICSFEEVDLKNSDNESTQSSEDHRKMYARPCRRYYLLPMMKKHHVAVIGCSLVSILLVIAISLSASIAVNNVDIEDTEDNSHSPDDVIVNDAPKHGSPSTLSATLLPTLFPSYSLTAIPTTLQPTKDLPSLSPTSFSNLSSVIPTSTPAASDSPSTKSSSMPTSSSLPTSSPQPTPPLFPLEPNGPMWFSNVDPEWLGSSYLNFLSFCSNKGMELCTYSEYCPSGKSSDPYNGGPQGLLDLNPNEWEQWSAVKSNNDTVEEIWVQVGKIAEGGGDDDSGGRCWTYSQWTKSSDVPTEPEKARWVLCCAVNLI